MSVVCVGHVRGSVTVFVWMWCVLFLCVVSVFVIGETIILLVSQGGDKDLGN